MELQSKRLMISSLVNFNKLKMSVVQKEYFTVQSHVEILPKDDSKPDPVYPEEPPFDNPTQIPPSLTHPHGLVGEELLLTDQAK
ncbi:hypothetical protein FACS189472_14080 [Alphaproteobacteria bacterium]|nr:hypothetical protein FACS189472_14080 [Alphaproteobacteria bacterium]